jgi:N-methylhydantoinase A
VHGVVLPRELPGARHVWHQYVIRAPRRDALREFLTARASDRRSTTLCRCTSRKLKGLGYAEGDFPEAERAAREVLALPIFPELREDEQQTVVAGDCGVLPTLRRSGALKRRLRALGIPVSASHRILPEFREYERASTTVVNAYLRRGCKYLGSAGERVARHFTGRARGCDAVLGRHYSRARCGARSRCGPCCQGRRAAWSARAAVAQWAGFERIIGFDMGGTSTDVFLADAAAAARSSRANRGGRSAHRRAHARHSYAGAGGGSIARFDAGGMLRVGPESAGAEPGPICFGRGERRPTVTDANLLLGRLDAESFLGGGVQLDRERDGADDARAKGPLKTVKNLRPASARGGDADGEGHSRHLHRARPRSARLYAGGVWRRRPAARLLAGAGAAHSHVLVPALPGALSAVGILLADTVRDYSRTVMLPGDAIGNSGIFAELEQRGVGGVCGGRP